MGEVRYPYLMSFVMAVAFWTLGGIIWHGVGHVLGGHGKVFDQLGSLLAFLAALSAWEWLRPIRQPPSNPHDHPPSNPREEV